MTVIPFKSEEQKAREEHQRRIVHKLEHLLEEARAGKITGIGYVLLGQTRGDVATGWMGGCRTLKEGTVVLYHRLLNACERNDL